MQYERHLVYQSKFYEQNCTKSHHKIKTKTAQFLTVINCTILENGTTKLPKFTSINFCVYMLLLFLLYNTMSAVPFQHHILHNHMCSRMLKGINFLWKHLLQKLASVLLSQINSKLHFQKMKCAFYSRLRCLIIYLGLYCNFYFLWNIKSCTLGKLFRKMNKT